MNYDFPVELRPAHVYLNDIVDGAPVLTKLPRVKAVVRTDKEEVIGQVSDRYKIFTHKQVMDQALKYADKLIGRPKLNVGLSQGGAFMCSKFDSVDKSFAVRNGDPVGFRVNIMNSYNGKCGLVMQVGGLVMKCMNGMVGMSDEDSYNLNWRHTREFELIDFPEPDLLIAAWDENCKAWANMAKMDMTEDDYDGLLRKAHEKSLISGKNMLVPDPHHREKTAWDLYNQLTYHAEHSDIVEHSRVNRLNRAAKWANDIFIDRSAA